MPAFVPLMPLNGKAMLGDLGRASSYFAAIFQMILLALALSGAVTPWFGPTPGQNALSAMQLAQPLAPSPSTGDKHSSTSRGPVMLVGATTDTRQFHWAEARSTP